jgi:energy-coupling factor transporter ATP-binding protein EcfA2
MLIDNPFMGLDQEYQVKLKEIIKTLIQKKRQVILLLNTHKEVPKWIIYIFLVKDQQALEKRAADEMVSHKLTAPGGIKKKGTPCCISGKYSEEGIRKKAISFQCSDHP